MSLPKRSRRSRYRGPACCTTHNYGPICTTHTGRLIQVTVCELDGILSFGPSPEATAIQPATPTGPEMEQRNCAAAAHDTTRHDNHHDTTPFDSSLDARPWSWPWALGWPHQLWPHFPARALAPYPEGAEMNMGPYAIIHARATGLFHPNQPLHTLLLFRAALQ